jgi:hypothetical protein
LTTNVFIMEGAEPPPLRSPLASVVWMEVLLATGISTTGGGGNEVEEEESMSDGNGKLLLLLDWKEDGGAVC